MGLGPALFEQIDFLAGGSSTPRCRITGCPGSPTFRPTAGGPDRPAGPAIGRRRRGAHHGGGAGNRQRDLPGVRGAASLDAARARRPCTRRLGIRQRRNRRVGPRATTVVCGYCRPRALSSADTAAWSSRGRHRRASRPADFPHLAQLMQAHYRMLVRLEALLTALPLGGGSRSGVVRSCPRLTRHWPDRAAALRVRHREYCYNPRAGPRSVSTLDTYGHYAFANLPVVTALRDLPGRAREALVLTYYLDLPEQQAAAVGRSQRGRLAPSPRHGVPRAARRPARPIDRHTLPGFMMPSGSSAFLIA